MKIRLAVVCALALMFSTASPAEEPGPQHQQLAALAGRWTVMQSMWSGANEAPKIDRGSATFSRVLGGRHLRQDLQIDSPGRPFEGLGYLGYDAATERYFSTWMDVNFTGIILAQGRYDLANKTYTFVAGTVREVLRVRDDDHFSFEYFETHGGKESLAIRLEYTRMK
jgi:hypothetical protein